MNYHKNYIYIFYSIFPVIFSLIGYPIDLQKILYGSNISAQFIPWSNEVSNNIKDGIYPYFSFNLNFGQDILGESTQGIANPIKIILLILGINVQYLDNYYVYISLLITYFGCIKLYYFACNNIFYSIIFSLLTILGLGSIVNIVHPFIISAISYFPWAFYLLLSVNSSNYRRYIVYLTLTFTFSILSGHYQIQWLIFFSLFVYSILNIKNNNLSIKLFLISIILAFSLCLFQLLPTIEIIGYSNRASPGGLDKFISSGSPITFLNYIYPSTNWILYKYVPLVYKSWGFSNLVENLHYISAVTIILIFSINYNLKESNNTLFYVLLITLVKALGVFAFINILLNFLPIFGQFRIPARNLLILDVLLILFLAINLKNIDYNKVIKNTKYLLIFSISYIFLVLLILHVNKSAIKLFDLFFIIYPIVLLIIIFTVIKFFKSNYLVLLFIISIIDVILIGYYSPKYYFNISSQTYLESTNNSLINCNKDSNLILNSRWLNWDQPIFNDFTSSKNSNTNVEPNSNNCTINHFFSSSTITPLWLSKFEYFSNQLYQTDKNNLYEKFGLEIVNNSASDLLISKTYNSNDKNSTYYANDINPLFDHIIQTWLNKLMWKITPYYYEFVKDSEIINFLPTKNIKSFEYNGKFYLPLSTINSFIVNDQDGFPVEVNSNSVLLSLDNFSKESSFIVTYIPVLSITGTLLTTLLIAIYFIIYLFSYKFNFKNISNKLYLLNSNSFFGYYYLLNKKLLYFAKNYNIFFKKISLYSFFSLLLLIIILIAFNFNLIFVNLIFSVLIFYFFILLITGLFTSFSYTNPKLIFLIYFISLSFILGQLIITINYIF